MNTTDSQHGHSLLHSSSGSPPSPLPPSPPETASCRLLFVVNETACFVAHHLPTAVAAREAGFAVHLAASNDARLQKVLDQGITYHPLRLDRTSLNPLHEMSLLYQLVRVVRRVQPTIMHTVTIKPVLYAGIIARLLRVPCLVSTICGLGMVFTGDDLSWRLLRRSLSLFYPLALGHGNSCTIFENPDDQRHLVDAGLVPLERTMLIRGLGVDLSAFKPSPEPPGPPTVILPARMIWPKGIREFVEAARRLRRAGLSARFALVGEPPAQHRASVPRAAIEAWVRDGDVEWWGHQTDMPAVYARSHIVCLPSYYGEGTPRTLMEAAACGRPIVAADTAGCRGVVRHNDNGLLVPARSVSALAEALHTLLVDQDRRLEMGRRGRALAIATLSAGRIAEEVVGVYRRLQAGDGRVQFT